MTDHKLPCHSTLEDPTEALRIACPSLQDLEKMLAELEEIRQSVQLPMPL